MKSPVTLKGWFIPIMVLVMVLSVQVAAARIQRGPVEKIVSVPVDGFIEGPSYNTEDGHLYFVEIEDGWISRVTPDGKYERFYDIGAPEGIMGPNGMLWDSKRKKLLIAHRDLGIVTLEPKTKKLETIVDNYQGKKFNGPNDLCLDSKGNIYFTDTWGTSISNPTGAVYRFDANNGEIIQLMSHLAFPNGILISPDEQYIYVAEFGQNRLLRAMLLNGGKATIYLHTMIYFNGGWGPDSMAMDADGNLYVAHFGSGKLYVVEPQMGEIIETIQIPDPEGIGPDNACFGGEDNKTLYITEGWKKEIYQVRVSIPGLPIPPEKK
jgi:sugar lactone lactonase YvrE